MVLQQAASLVGATRYCIDAGNIGKPEPVREYLAFRLVRGFLAHFCEGDQCRCRSPLPAPYDIFTLKETGTLIPESQFRRGRKWAISVSNPRSTACKLIEIRTSINHPLEPNHVHQNNGVFQRLSSSSKNENQLFSHPLSQLTIFRQFIYDITSMS